MPTIIGIAASITVPGEAISFLLESSIQLSIPYQIPKKDKNNPRIRYKEAILKFLKKPNDVVHIPRGTIHRIENPFKQPVIIMEVQTGEILKESDIIRYKDIYGRVN